MTISRAADRGLSRAVRTLRSAGRRVPPRTVLFEGAARIGYGARGFVFLTVGAVALLAALGVMGDTLGSGGAVTLVANQPFGRVWLSLLGLGLWSFVLWRALQAVADADHEGRSWRGLAMRAGQAMSGIFYGLLAASVFELLDEAGEAAPDDGGEEAARQAAAVLEAPNGDWLLMGVGLFILGMGAGNIIKGARGDFAGALACDARTCRRVVPLARAGYMARGLVYLPMGVFVFLAGLHTRAEEARSFGASLEVLQSQPFGTWILGLTGLGLMAFGGFAFVEARWRRIRPPKDLKPR